MKDAHKAMCRNSTEENKNLHKSQNKAKEAVLMAIREMDEEALDEMQNCLNGMFRPVKGLKLTVR